MTDIRTRFAPSPTGFLHVGNVRAALFPWLVAKHAGGALILRVEDTDQAREVEGAVQVTHDTLAWLGIEWSEGPDIGGPYAPYTQSERRDIYLRWAQKLIDTGRAYADIRTPEELDGLRTQARADKKAFLAREHRPENPPVWELGMPLRFRSEPRAYEWHDEVMGDLSAGEEVIDDFIILKSDGLPTYNFAHIVDDAEMKITHVIRGLEYISSMPKYLNLYDALGLPWPIFAHTPHIMAEDGKKKLSKRDGAKGILDYRDEGYLPEAMLNFLASMGWNDGTEQELFTRDELITKFSLERVQRSGARFDEKRLEWMNGQFIRRLSIDDLEQRVVAFWPESAADATPTYKQSILTLVQDRLKTLADLPLLTEYFFTTPTPDWQMVQESKQLRKIDASHLVSLLVEARSALAASEFTPDTLTATLNQLLAATGEKPGTLFSIIRLAISWAPFSPALPDTLAAIGKENSLSRLDSTIASAHVS